MHPLIIVILTQALFTTSDVIARSLMVKHGFTRAAFLTSGFLIYFLIRQIAMFGQLYVFANIPLGKTMALFGAVSIVLANLLGFFLLQELLTLKEYFAISFVIVAYLILAFA